MISENIAKRYNGSYFKERYYDIMHPKPEDTRTAEEIISHIQEKLKE